MSKGLILPSIPFLNLFLYLSFPKDRSRVIYARNSSPEILCMHTRSRRLPSLTCITSSSNYQAAPATLPLPLPIPLQVYIETKGMGLVWPAYLNAPAIELRSSFPVHITQGSDKPPRGAGETESSRWGDGNERLGVFWSGFKVNILPVLYQISDRGVCSDTIHFFASMSQRNLQLPS